MAAVFTLRMSAGRKNYSSLRLGFEDLYRQSQLMRRQATKIARKEMQVYLTRTGRKLARKHSRKWSYTRSSRRKNLYVRSGRLVKALRRSVVIRGRKLPDVKGSIRLPDYALTHEEGRVIRAKRAKYLAIPLRAALDNNGIEKRRGPRAWENTFTVKTKRGHLFVAHKRGKKIEMLYLLKKSVRIPERLGLGEALEEGAEDFSERVLTRLLTEAFRG